MVIISTAPSFRYQTLASRTRSGPRRLDSKQFVIGTKPRPSSSTVPRADLSCAVRPESRSTVRGSPWGHPHAASRCFLAAAVKPAASVPSEDIAQLTCTEISASPPRRSSNVAVPRSASHSAKTTLSDCSPRRGPKLIRRRLLNSSDPLNASCWPAMIGESMHRALCTALRPVPNLAAFATPFRLSLRMRVYRARHAESVVAMLNTIRKPQTTMDGSAIVDLLGCPAARTYNFSRHVSAAIA